MKGTLAALFLAVAISVVDAQVVDECLDASQLLMSTVDAVNRLSARIDGLESMVSAGRDKLTQWLTWLETVRCGASSLRKRCWG